ncbi:hypothetical protein P7L75_09290 [Tistrella mobilis]|uniref:hypothetical protein n=1 Tax=Tistrella mobilis TaxID=171437 RepID=UPI0035587397
MLVDRGLQTTATQGTGDLVLIAPDTGLRPLTAASDGAVIFYQILTTGLAWEIGIGTVHIGPPATLSRDTVIASSIGSARLNLPAGVHSVFSVLPAAHSIYRDAAGTPRSGADVLALAARQIATSAGLAGGGDLTADRSLSLDFAALGSRAATAAGDEVIILTAGGDHIRVPASAVIAGLALASRSVTAAGLATGGGDLTADRTITVPAATNAQAIAGTATTVAMTPAATAAALTAGDRLGACWTSPEIAITNGADDSYSHGLGVVPRLVAMQLVCVTAAHGYSVGDVINLSGGHMARGSGESSGTAVVTSATTIRLIQAAAGPVVTFISAGGGVVDISKSAFRIVLRAWA